MKNLMIDEYDPYYGFNSGVSEFFKFRHGSKRCNLLDDWITDPYNEMNVPERLWETVSEFIYRLYER